MLWTSAPEDTFSLPAHCATTGPDGETAGGNCLECSRVCEVGAFVRKLFAWQQAAADHFVRLTPREQEVMGRVLDGHPSKNISADLGISQRTVENHRAAIMRKTGSRNIPALIRLAVTAD